MNNLPSGTITFVFTDIEGSTQLWERHPESMKATLAKHDSILSDSIQSNRGHVIKRTGDGIHAVFKTPSDAVKAAIVAQQEFQRPVGELTIKVRMGLHTGEAELRDHDYFGSVPNRAARLMSAANGDQILISSATAELVRRELPPNTTLRNLGEYNLRDLVRPETVHQVIHASLPSEFPPIKQVDGCPTNVVTL